MVGRGRLVALWLLAGTCAPALAVTETQYLALFVEGKKVGHAIHTRADWAGQVTTTDDLTMTITRLGDPMTIRSTVTNVETAGGKPLRFESVEQSGASASIKVAGSIKDDGAMEVARSLMGKEQKSTGRWPGGAVLAEGRRLLALKMGLRPGTAYTVPLFVSSLAQAVNAKTTVGQVKPVEVLGRSVRLTEVTTVFGTSGQEKEVSYVDDHLRPLKSLVPIAGFQVEMIDCARDVALGQGDGMEILSKMFVKSPMPIQDVGSASSITYTLDSGPGANLVLPSTDCQTAKRLPDGKIALVVQPATVMWDGTFPYRGNDPKLLEALRPNRFVQSDDPRIVELARQAVGGSVDAVEAAHQIEAFVAQYIRIRSLSVGYASAVEVAQSRQGDCTEFAVLTAALCRAAGIPAQVVFGIVYVRDFGGTDGFGGHAWVQAYVGINQMGGNGKWIGLDAALKSAGRGGYDAGHIALALSSGDPTDSAGMATTLDQLKIERIDVQRRP